MFKLGKFLENDPTVPPLPKFQRFISNYSLRDVLKYEVMCLGHLDHTLSSYSPNDILTYLLNNGVIFSDEDKELIEKNKQKGYYQLNYSNKLEKLSNTCNEYLELFCEGIYEVVI